MAKTPATPQPTISGIDVMRGVGAKPAKGFWAEAWDRVVVQWGARLSLAWIAVIAFFAVLAPFLASGLPLWTRQYSDVSHTELVRAWSPLWEGLSSIDLALLIGVMLGLPFVALPMKVVPLARSYRLGIIGAVVLQAGITLIAIWVLSGIARGNDASEWMRVGEENGSLRWTVSFAVAGVVALFSLMLPTFHRLLARLPLVALVLVGTALIGADRWSPPIATFDRYVSGEMQGTLENTYTLVPWSPNQSRTDFYLIEPMTTVAEDLVGEPEAEYPFFGERRFLLGTDGVGQDVLSQMMHACRLSISVGLVSTGISVVIGIIIGSLMGYFGGWVDLVLSRIVEVFMAIPVLFLLIVAAAVLPRNTYVMMAIIGCVSWTMTARFIRAEFLSLRKQDFVQAARAAGLPLRSVLFKHMLPNGITPVLVQASFAIAAAILAEATLSFLGLGPIDQASWGKLLSSATSVTGSFVWWLAIFPGAAIFLTVLAYNLLGEAFRDAIDPKLRKAAH